MLKAVCLLKRLTGKTLTVHVVAVMHLWSEVDQMTEESQMIGENHAVNHVVAALEMWSATIVIRKAM